MVNKIKNIIFKYNIETFSSGQNNFSNYWTTNGDMITYYKNNSEFKDTFLKCHKLFAISQNTGPALIKHNRFYCPQPPA